MLPQLIPRNANLPPRVLQENAFTYQTNTPPYHFDASSVYQNLHSHNNNNNNDDDNDNDNVFDNEEEQQDALFEVSESESEEEEEEEQEGGRRSYQNDEEEHERTHNLALINQNRSFSINCDRRVVVPSLIPTTATATITSTLAINSNCRNQVVYHTQSNDSSDSCVLSSILSNTAQVTVAAAVVNPDVGEDNDPSDNIDNSPYYSDYISNEGQDSTSDEDFFDNCNVGDDSDEANRPIPSFYRFMSDEGMSSDEHEQEDSENETNANDWVICEDLDV